MTAISNRSNELTACRTYFTHARNKSERLLGFNLFGILAFLLLVLFALPALAATRVVYPAFESLSDTRYNDLVEILQTALEKTVPEFGPYTLEASAIRMNEARYLGELRAKTQINIAWSSTSPEKEQIYLPIRIPLRKGILGYRVALIAKGKQAEIDKIKKVDDLRNYVVGQGIGWGDVRLYEANQIKVVTASYESLFAMVAAERFDLFPRGISEAFVEQEARVGRIQNLAVEQNLLIYYPWPYYFFFNKEDHALAARIEVGIRKMIRDGSFDVIFQKYNGAAIRKARLKERRVIKIQNPFLPKETPLNDPSLWFDPGKP